MFKVGDIIVPDQAKTFMDGVGWGSNSVNIKYFKKAEILSFSGKSELHIELIGGLYDGIRIYVRPNNNRFRLENSEEDYEIY